MAKKINMTTRRELLKTGLYAAGAVALGPYTRILGSNDDVRIAVIGFRGRGGGLMSSFEGIDGVKVVALCDVDQGVLDREAAKRPGVFATRDLREIMDRQDVDAVVCAAPNHWHSLVTVWACQAGKDVYIEKPVSHSIWEGRKMVEAARKYDRVVAAGFQNRSDAGLVPFMQYLHAGNIGKVTAVRGLCYRSRGGIGLRQTPLTPPENVDYDLWLGPAADLPMMRNQFHYDWHWIWNTGNGDVGNQGPHELDLMRWALNDPAHPRSVRSLGGRFVWGDAGETPNTLITKFDFDGVPGIFEVNDIPNGRNSQNYRGVGVGVIITCEGGEFRGGRGGGKVYDRDGRLIKDFPGDSGGRHQANFIDAVRSRDSGILTSEIENGHASTVLAHLANISYRAGSLAQSSSVKQIGREDGAIADAIVRYEERLSDNGVDLGDTPWRLGPKLTFDGGSERFVGRMSSAGNWMIKRNYRKPFVVPDKV
ncbi:MAG: Gfo/Idh/MocA family oxidoreductase [Armatimonadetes bacterium]|nr:Gfo/Idh/MocA family oxidoreductase [Armatimonadota bacterium]